MHLGTGGAAGVSREGQGWSDTFLLEHESMDLVIMNPPFTRPTNHEATTVPVPSFAGLGNDAEEQAAMSRLLKDIRRDIEEPAGHGNAGLASNFLDLAHAKVKPGGVLALVMPLSLLQGGAWGASRALLRTQYERTTVIGLAAPGRDEEKSFSADTGMGEVLVVARRRRPSRGAARKARKAADPPVTFVALRKHFRARPFLPANEAYRDRTRHALDEAVLVELLGRTRTVLEPLALLRRQWSEEPTVHGGKATRP